MRSQNFNTSHSNLRSVPHQELPSALLVQDEPINRPHYHRHQNTSSQAVGGGNCIQRQRAGAGGDMSLLRRSAGQHKQQSYRGRRSIVFGERAAEQVAISHQQEDTNEQETGQR